MERFSMAELKKRNYSDIYRHLYHNPGASKQSIAAALRMSLPTVSQHLTALLDDGLVRKGGPLDSVQLGRRATSYAVIADARVAIGVEMLSEKLELAALDLYGKSLAQQSLLLHFSMEEDYYAAVGRAVLDFMERSGFQRRQILGVGVAVQGLVSSDGDEVVYGKTPGCTGLRIESFRSRLADFPCRFLHDADCAALSELWLSGPIRDAVFLSLGYHLGSAIIIGGDIFRGHMGRGGTIEHMKLIPKGKACYCGQMGCAESYCAIHALLEDSGETLCSFFERKRAGERSAAARWRSYLRHLAQLIHNAHMLLDGDILLGGHLAGYFEQDDLTSLGNLVRSHTPFPQEAGFIRRVHSTANVVSFGAAVHYLREFMDTR